MRFERIGRVVGLDMWGTCISNYQFVLSYDEQAEVWGASWKHTNHLDGRAIPIGENIHPELKYPFFKSMLEAEHACQKTLRELKQKN